MVRWLHYKYNANICQKPRETINISIQDKTLDEKLVAKKWGRWGTTAALCLIGTFPFFTMFKNKPKTKQNKCLQNTKQSKTKRK